MKLHLQMIFTSFLIDVLKSGPCQRQKVVFFAGREPKSITLRQILDAKTPEQAATLAYRDAWRFRRWGFRMKFKPTAQKPAQRFFRFFAFFCVVICWGAGGGVGGCDNVLRLIALSSIFFGDQTSCYVAHFCSTSVTKLHVTLHTSVVLRWAHFMLRCTLLLYFGDQTSCYVAHFCCTPVNTLHTLRCTLLLYVGEHTSCYVARLCCTSVNRLHVTLYAYEFVNHSKGQFTKTARRVQRGSPKVLAACTYWYNR